MRYVPYALTCKSVNAKQPIPSGSGLSGSVLTVGYVDLSVGSNWGGSERPSTKRSFSSIPYKELPLFISCRQIKATDISIVGHSVNVPVSLNIIGPIATPR